MKLWLLTLLILSSSLTTLPVFADRSEADRRRLVVVAYEQIPEVVDFLARSQEFRAQLTEKEKEQLNLLYQVTEMISAERQWGQSLPYPSAIPKIEFSADQKIFTLHPQEPTRLAITWAPMAEPIVFNLPYLNSPSFDPSYLDMIQLMVHELGHKLDKREDVAALDSIGAKMRLFLAPYYHVAKFGLQSRIEVLSLPSLVARIQVRPHNPAPYFLLSENGIVVYHRMDLAQVVYGLHRFTARPEGSGNILEHSTYRLTDLQVTAPKEGSLSFAFDFNLEIQSQLVLHGPSSRMVPGAMLRDGSQMLIPVPTIFGLVAPSFGNLHVSTRTGRAKQDSTPQMLVPSVEGWDYADISFDAEVVKLVHNDQRVNVSLKSRHPIQSLQLMIETTDGSLLIDAEQTAAGEFAFNLPDRLPQAKARYLIVNGESKTLLPQVLSFTNAKAMANAAPMPSGQMEIFNGREWQSYTGREILKAAPGPLRLRLVTQSPAQDVRQIRLRWIEGADIYWEKPEQVSGTYGHIFEETIRHFSKIEKTATNTIYEFESKTASQFHKPSTLHEIVGAKNSGRRFLKELLITNQDLRTRAQQYSPALKIYNQEFIQVDTNCESQIKIAK